MSQAGRKSGTRGTVRVPRGARAAGAAGRGRAGAGARCGRRRWSGAGGLAQPGSARAPARHEVLARRCRCPGGRSPALSAPLSLPAPLLCCAARPEPGGAGALSRGRPGGTKAGGLRCAAAGLPRRAPGSLCPWGGRCAPGALLSRAGLGSVRASRREFLLPASARAPRPRSPVPPGSPGSAPAPELPGRAAWEGIPSSRRQRFPAAVGANPSIAMPCVLFFLSLLARGTAPLGKARWVREPGTSRVTELRERILGVGRCSWGGDGVRAGMG